MIEGDLRSCVESVEILCRSAALNKRGYDYSPDIRGVANGAVGLKLALIEKDAIRRAWEDIVDIAAADAPAFNIIQERTALLVSQLDCTERGGESLVKEASGTLVGADTPLCSRLPVDERIGYITQSFEADPKVMPIVVWIGYSGAVFSEPSIDAGDIFFMSGQILGDELARINVPFKDELHLLRGSVLSPGGDGACREVDFLARVNLGVRSLFGAKDAAIGAVEAILEVSSLWGSGWEPRRREVHVLAEGRLRSWTGGLSANRSPSAFELRQDFQGIAQNGKTLSRIFTRTNLPVPISSAREALVAAGRVRAQRRDPRALDAVEARLLVAYDDRALQQIAALNGMEIQDYAEPLKKGWAVYSWISQIDSAVRMAVAGASFTDERARLRGEYLSEGGWNHVIDFSLDNRVRLGCLADEALVDSKWVADVLGSLVDLVARRQMLSSAAKEGEMLESRRRRVRNAVAHGNPLSDESVKSVVSYSDWAARGMFSSAITSLDEGREMMEVVYGNVGYWSRLLEDVAIGALFNE
ncbi:hypothetical protein GCM10028787_06020 [Brachybacterium horti]